MSQIRKALKRLTDGEGIYVVLGLLGTGLLLIALGGLDRFEWANRAQPWTVGILAIYFWAFQPSAIAYWLICLLPLTVVGLSLLTCYLFGKGLWREATLCVFTIKIGWPILRSSSLESLRDDLRTKFQEEHKTVKTFFSDLLARL